MYMLFKNKSGREAKENRQGKAVEYDTKGSP
jgi:hypothetical protein